MKHQWAGFALMAAGIVSLAIASTRAAATPAHLRPEVTDVFAAGQDGYATYRIPGIVMTKTGTIMAYCEARKSGASD